MISEISKTDTTIIFSLRVCFLSFENNNAKMIHIEAATCIIN